MLRHSTGHWPSDHMIRSQPLIGWPSKIVSKVLEEICFKDFVGKLFQRFWRKLVSKILEENISKIAEKVSFKDFGGKLF